MPSGQNVHDPIKPVRVLVQTKTGLVPGADQDSKLFPMLDRIALHHWGSAFEAGEDRFYDYGTEYAYDNRRCFFLVDHGTSPIGSDDPFHIPIVRYEWTGTDFKHIPGSLPNDIREKMKEYPFKPQLKRSNTDESPQRVEQTPEEHRRIIRRKLKALARLQNRDHRFLHENPEHLDWLKTHVEPKLWENFEASVKEWERRKALGIQTVIITADGREIEDN